MTVNSQKTNKNTAESGVIYGLDPNDDTVTNALKVNANGAIQLAESISISTTLTYHKLSSAANTNATSVKGSSGVVYAGHITNLALTTKFVKFYDKATAPTVGTDTPVWTIAIPALISVEIPTIVSIYGMNFANGIAYAITGGASDGDATAVGAGDVLVNLGYV